MVGARRRGLTPRSEVAERVAAQSWALSSRRDARRGCRAKANSRTVRFPRPPAAVAPACPLGAAVPRSSLVADRQVPRCCVQSRASVSIDVSGCMGSASNAAAATWIASIVTLRASRAKRPSQRTAARS
jgi:hypothetical protein